MLIFLQPLKIMFLAIYTPVAPRPNNRILALDCLLTASIPIAPMYLLHLSFTFSSLMSSSFKLVSSFLSYSTSTSSMFSSLDSILTFFFFSFFGLLMLGFKSLCDGSGSLFSSYSSSLMAFSSMVLYSVFDFLN